MRVTVPWSGCVPNFMMTIWMHHFQGKVWWRTTLFLETWRVASSILVTILYSHLYYACISCSLFIACLMFIDYYENALIIRPLTCMYSLLRHPCLYGSINLCSHHLFSYHVYHRFNNMWIYIIIMFMFIMLIYALFLCFMI